MTVELADAIEAIWAKSRGEMDRRIVTLEDAVAAAVMGDLDPGLRQSAVTDAHKLAGSLAMFGLPAGSELAREVERALGAPPDHPSSDLAAAVLRLRREFESRRPTV